MYRELQDGCQSTEQKAGFVVAHEFHYVDHVRDHVRTNRHFCYAMTA